MNILVLYPGSVPQRTNDLSCFSDVLGFYLLRELRRHTQTRILEIPRVDTPQLIAWFDQLDLTGVDAVLALGLRYFSTVDPCIGRALQTRMWPQGFVCQIHDGSRLDNDPVDITFTLKDESQKYHFASPANRYVRHRAYNHPVGWAADPELNTPQQDNRTLRILVDHTNYGSNPLDHTAEILLDIQRFVRGRAWRTKWKSVQVRRFDSGCVVDVDIEHLPTEISRYDRSATMPYVEITKEHGQAHIFCVTHPESVGLVVLETALAGALPVVPKGFVPSDRLATVRHLVYDRHIDWNRVIDMIDPTESRKTALDNNWTNMALRIRSEIWTRQRIRQRPILPHPSPEIDND